MRGSRSIRVLLVAAATGSMGCATTFAFASGGMEPVCASGNPYPFIGTNVDVRIVVGRLILFGKPSPFPWEWRALAAIDTPLSLAADTATLPITVPLQIIETVGCSLAARSDEKPILIQKSGSEVETDQSAR